MTKRETHVYSAGVIAVIIVLLLLAFKRNSINNTIIEDAPDLAISVHPDFNDYQLPSFDMGRDSGYFDWMQTTNLSCDCDEDAWQAPPGPREIITLTYPVYKYASTVEYLTGPAAPEMPVYVPPALPTWWYAVMVGMQKDHGGPYPLQIIETSTGQKFQTWKADRFGPSVIAVASYTLSGDDLYYAAKRYRHDPSRDKAAPYKPWQIGYASSGG